MNDPAIKRYQFDSQRSRFTVQAFAAGLLGGFGHDPKFLIRQFDGEIKFAPGLPAESFLEIKVKAASLELTDGMKAEHREEIQNTAMNQVLEVNKYPEITFRSREIAVSKIADNWFRAQINGEMNLHGVTKPLSIDSQLRLIENSLRLTGEFPLQFANYRIQSVSGLSGLIKLKSELKFQFNLVGQEQES